MLNLCMIKYYVDWIVLKFKDSKQETRGFMKQ